MGTRQHDTININCQQETLTNFRFSTAELMQTKYNFFAGAVHCYFLQETILTRYTYIPYISTALGGGQQLAYTGEGRGVGWVAPAAKHQARKRSEKPAHLFGFPCSRPASLDPDSFC